MSNDGAQTWSDAYIIRYNESIKPIFVKNNGWETMNLYSGYTAGSTIETTIAIALYNGKVYMMFKWGDNPDWRIFKSFDNNAGQIVMIGAGTACSISGLTMSETVPTDVVTIINNNA